MPDQASINRSLNTIRTELEYLQQCGAVAPAQFQSIMAQLPQGNGQQSQYIDPRYDPNDGFNPSKITQEAQDPTHPAHPQNPKVCHMHIFQRSMYDPNLTKKASRMGKENGYQIWQCGGLWSGCNFWWGLGQ
ncbi:hypothetical protein NHQ30_010354 [Ciborinia camelliae]|nr:hypothetical protein NHQ30_010354 [Ciborinia camelliae]